MWERGARYTNDDLRAIKPYASERQALAIELALEHPTRKVAAKAMGITIRRFSALISAAAVKAHSESGFQPSTEVSLYPVPDGYRLKGTSTLVDGDGSAKLQWVKTDVDEERQRAMMREAFEAMGQKLPRLKPVAAPDATNADLLSLYVITDYHLGMMAWSEETGADWDTKIAETLLVDWFAAAISMAPDSEVGILAQLGDFLHWDGLDAVTPTSRHILDADTRFAKLVRVTIRVIRRIIGMLLEKHQTVHILMAEGNHDMASSVWLREWLAAIHEGDPRVTVDQSVDPYYCYEWGDVSLFFHHGHKRKPASLDDVLAAKYREVFGRTTYSYAHTGHMHNKQVRETNLMVLEQHRTLAAPDAHAARGGWMSGRDASVITYHRNHGEVGRLTLSPAMIQKQHAA